MGTCSSSTATAAAGDTTPNHNSKGETTAVVDPNSKVYKKWLTKVSNDGAQLRKAPIEIRANADIVLAAISDNGYAMEHAAEELKQKKDFVLQAVSIKAWAIKYASKELQNDQEFIKECVSRNGRCLQFTNETMRSDKVIVMIAATSYPDALKHALNGLMEDKDCLIAAKIFEKDHYLRTIQQLDGGGNKTTTDDDDENIDTDTKWIVVSSRFSSDPTKKCEATNLLHLLQNHDFVQYGCFSINKPNTLKQATCDPSGEYTNLRWPCRGTYETCQIIQDDPFKQGEPTDHKSCWRYAFCGYLKRAKHSGGFMLQVVEAEQPKNAPQLLANSQKIESEMALEVGCKVFCIHRPRNEDTKEEEMFTSADVERVVAKIQQWYDSGCSDMSECTIQFPR